MEKNWLIRTHSNQILGPVTKEKIVELFNKSALSDLDEVCTGNGYWFFVRETELVQKFVFGNEVQGFNPVTETIDVLTSDNKDRHANVQEMGEASDVTNIVKLDSTQALSNKPKQTNFKAAPLNESDLGLYPKDEDLAFPDLDIGQRGPDISGGQVKKK